MSDFGGASTEPAVRMEVAEIAYGPAEDAAPAPEPPWNATPSRIWSSRSRSPAGGTDEYYQLLVSYRPAPHDDLHHAEIARMTDPDLGPVVAYDAAQDPDACRVVVRSLLSGRRLRSPDTEVRFCPSRTALGLSGGLRGSSPPISRSPPPSSRGSTPGSRATPR